MNVYLLHSEFVSGMKHVALLQSGDEMPNELGPLMEPDPVPFSFSTPGWYFLGGLLILTLLYASVKVIKKYRQNAYRRKALARINELSNSKGKLEDDQYLIALLALLKNVAIQSYGRVKVASKTGKDWCAFLESTGKNTPFSNYETILADAAFKQITPDDATIIQISDLTKRWIKTHA
jgi:hypothetical protein